MAGFSRRTAVHEYEIRILQREGASYLITAQIHLSDAAAIQAARRMALGRQFEVWRDMECITGFAAPPPVVPTPENKAAK